MKKNIPQGGGTIVDELFISKKIPDGKLVQVDMSVKNGRILSIIIAGDFFLHPEEAIEIVESRLVGASLQEIPTIFENACDEEWSLIGATWEQIGELVLQCLQSERTQT